MDEDLKPQAGAETISPHETEDSVPMGQEVEEATGEELEEAGIIPVPVEELSAIKEEINTWQAKAEENLDGWQRTLAEFSNFKKRVDREQAQAYQRAVGQVILQYLVIMDDLELALKNRPTEGEGASWAEGIELIYRKLQGMLEAEGIKPIEADGAMFDPNFHEAISLEPNEEFESGHVIEVLQNGYRLNDQVLRPARVRVAQ